jgi:hypothetical protein
VTNETDLRKITDELRKLLPDHPLAFRVRFTLDPGAMSRDLMSIVSRVRIPRPLRGDAGQLQEDARMHLLDHVIPSLARIRSSRAYLATSVRNFYLDRLNALRRRPEVPFVDAEVDAHIGRASARARTSVPDQVDALEPAQVRTRRKARRSPLAGRRLSERPPT